MFQKPHLHSNQLTKNPQQKHTQASPPRPPKKQNQQNQNKKCMQFAILSNVRAKHQQVNPPSFLKNYDYPSLCEILL